MTINIKQKTKSYLYPLLVVIFVYVVLFEFVLEVNKFLPKPSLLLESFPALIKDYDLLNAAGLTTTVIYASLILGYILIHFIAGGLIKIFIEYPGLFNGLRIFRNFPAFFYAVLFAFWFGDSLIAEFFFGFTAVLFLVGLSVFENLKTVKEEYVLVARNLDLPQSKIYKNVIWKSIQPKVFNSLKRTHFYMWVLILIYEFIGGRNGFGGIYNLALSYNDLAALFAMAILISVLIWLGKIIIKYSKNRIAGWEL